LAKNLDPLNCIRQIQINLFGGIWLKNTNEKGWEAKKEQQFIYCTKSKMKEFDKIFLECPLVGVKAKIN
jgi:hypothetical protein